MCTDETTTYESPDETASGTYESPDGTDQGSYEAPDDGAAGGRPAWSRRTFLKAAALGTAAAALLNRAGSGDLNFGPLAALADDLSALQCTANDMRVIGA